ECLDALEFVHDIGPRFEGSTARPATSRSALSSPLDLPAPLGDFRVLREIGRGGMGVVYEAEQLSLGRRIALKVLPFAFTLDTRQLQRFKNEARAAAQLHHSNIVPIYSVGCERGVHFYAMQYIEGQPLAAVIDELRHLPPAPTVADGPIGVHSNLLPEHGFQDSQPTGPYFPSPPDAPSQCSRTTLAV